MRLLLTLLVSATPVKAAVLDVATTKVDPELVRTLTEVLGAEVHQSGAFDEVITGRDIVDMLQFEEKKQMMGCDTDSCLAEIGGALGVDKLVTSHVGRVDRTYVVTLKVVDIRAGRTERRIYRTVEGEPAVLLDVIRDAVPELLGTEASSAPAAATAEATVEPSDDGGPGVLPVVLWAAGGVALGTGVAFGLKTKGHERAASDPTFVGAQHEISAGRTSALIANVALVSGTALVVSGLVAWLLDL